MLDYTDIKDNMKNNDTNNINNIKIPRKYTTYRGFNNKAKRKNIN